MRCLPGMSLIFLFGTLSLNPALAQQKSDVHAMIANQSAVRSQGNRYNCTVFSVTAALEYKLARIGYESPQRINLSEQWLSYLVSPSIASKNLHLLPTLDAIGAHGFVDERTWQYNPNTFRREDLTQSSHTAYKVCSMVMDSPTLENCLAGQGPQELLRLPDDVLLDRTSPFHDRAFKDIRDEARSNLAGFKVSGSYIKGRKTVLSTLNAGEPVVLGVELFRQAWNHGSLSDFGLKRDKELFQAGVVNYPHKDSMDRALFTQKKNRLGHSVLIVGYDLDRVIERNVEGRNGQALTVSTKGVYYFKNSWGTDGFGRNFTIDGKNYPGYGMIAMDYADEFGRFMTTKVQKR